MSRSNHRDRNRRPARGSSGRASKHRILVVTEGDVTEPEYFRGFQRVHRQAVIEIKIEPAAQSSLSIVRFAKTLHDEAALRARREQDENLRFNEVWCVFDVDDHHYLSEARLMAEANDIHLAICNPSFDLWLLLHFLDHPPGEAERHVFRRSVQSYLPRFTQDNKHVDFRDCESGYLRAVELAKRLTQLAESIGEPGRNPTTGVYRLTERIRLGHGD